MLPYFLKSRKIRKVKIQKSYGLKKEEECFYQNAQCVIVKHRNFLKHKKLGDY